MTDTKPETATKQLEIMLLKSESERFRIGNELNAFGRKVLADSILRENPGISELDLKIEVFKRCYSSFYSKEELDHILISMREYHIRLGFH
jgi:hypothetical protein